MGVARAEILYLRAALVVEAGYWKELTFHFEKLWDQVA